MRTAETILGIIHNRGQLGQPLERVYRLLYNPNLYLMGYAEMYSNQGALTKGINEDTVDGMSRKRIEEIIDKLRNEQYNFSPARRTYIEKSNSKKKRPLGIPTWSDKLVQYAIKSILEAYFEPQFSQHSHGFRPRRGCHTALTEVHRQWKGTTWFIEGDIKGCFDNIDHSILLNILSLKIRDGRFLNLIRKLLQSGYIEKWRYNKTYSGTPQGGIVSPLLANIYLNELDKFAERELLRDYNRGKQRSRNKRYEYLRSKYTFAKRAGKVEEANVWNQLSRQIPSKDTHDPEYRRLRYIRYADDFLLGFNGPKAEAEEIKSKIGAFLNEKLSLALSRDKTLITNGRLQRAKFLGYEISIGANNTKNDRSGKRGVNGNVRLHVPISKVKKFLAKYKLKGKARRRPEMLEESVFEIIRIYQSRYRGFAQYYQLAEDRSYRISQVKWIMEHSLVLTLANKLDIPVSKVYKKYGQRINNRKVLVCSVTRKNKTYQAVWGNISLARSNVVPIKDHIYQLPSSSTEITQRLLANECELCGSHDRVQVHHVKSLKDLKKQGKKPLPSWKLKMISRARKTLVVCSKCHVDIHHGRYDRNVD